MVRYAELKRKSLFQIIVDLAESDNSSVEEFEDASETFNEDDIFVDVETKRMQPLSKLCTIFVINCVLENGQFHWDFRFISFLIYLSHLHHS